MVVEKYAALQKTINSSIPRNSLFFLIIVRIAYYILRGFFHWQKKVRFLYNFWVPVQHSEGTIIWRATVAISED